MNNPEIKRKFIKEPLINLKITQRDLKRAAARQRLKLMAVVLNKNGNAANVRLRSRLDQKKTSGPE